MKYSNTSGLDSLGKFSYNEIGLGYKPDLSEAVVLGFSEVFDKFIFYPAAQQYKFLGLAADVMGKTQGFVGPAIMATASLMGLKRLTLLVEKENVKEHEKRHAAHYFTRNYLDLPQFSENDRRHNLEEIITRTENLHDNKKFFNKITLLENMVSDGVGEALRDVTKTVFIPGIILYAVGNSSPWATALGIGFAGSYIGTSNLTTKERFPYTVNPVKRTKILWNTHKFVDSYLNCNTDYVPLLPVNSLEKLERKKEMIKERVQEEKLYKKVLEKSDSYQACPDENDICEWLKNECRDFKKITEDKEYPRTALAEYEKLENIFVPKEVKYDKRFIFKMIKDSISNKLHKN